MRGKLNVVIWIQNYSGCFVDRLHSLVKMWHLLWCEKSSDCLRRSHHQQWRCRARQMCLDWMFSLEHLTLGLRPVVEWQTWHSLRPAGIKVQHKSQLQHLCPFLQLLPHSHRAAFSPSQDLSGGYMWLSCHPVVADFHSIALLHYFLILIHINSVVSAFLHTFPLLYLLKLPPCLHHFFLLCTVSTWAAYPRPSQIPNSPHHLWAYPVQLLPPPLVFPVLPVQPLLLPLP